MCPLDYIGYDGVCVKECPPNYHYAGGRCRAPCEYMIAYEHEGECPDDGDCISLGDFLCIQKNQIVYLKANKIGNCLERNTPCESISKAYNIFSSNIETRKILFLDSELILPSPIYPEIFSFKVDDNIGVDIFLLSGVPIQTINGIPEGTAFVPLAPPSSTSSLTLDGLFLKAQLSNCVFDFSEGRVSIRNSVVYLMYLEDSSSNNYPVISVSDTGLLELINTEIHSLNSSFNTIIIKHQSSNKLKLNKISIPSITTTDSDLSSIAVTKGDVSFSFLKLEMNENEEFFCVLYNIENTSLIELSNIEFE
jgi:hypothetical protein